MILLGVVCLGQCSNRSLPSPGQEVAEPSPLARLMRIMTAHADSSKAAIDRGAELPPFPEAIRTITTATPTEGMHIDPITFPTFAHDYQRKVEALYAAEMEDRTMAYNSLVQSCVNCHSMHCPGPLMKIKKMYAEE